MPPVLRANSDPMPPHFPGVVPEVTSSSCLFFASGRNMPLPNKELSVVCGNPGASFHRDKTLGELISLNPQTSQIGFKPGSFSELF